MAKEIRIAIKSGFDPSGVSDASRALEKMAEDLEKSNKWLLQINAELSDAMHKRAQSVAVDMAAAADKAAKGMGNTYRTLGDFLGDVRKESQEASRKLENLRAKIQAVSRAASEHKPHIPMANIGKEASNSVGGVSKLNSAIGILTQNTGYFGKMLTEIFKGGLWGAGAAAVRLLYTSVKDCFDKIKQEAEDLRKQNVDIINATAKAVEGYKIAIDEELQAEVEASNAVLERKRNELDLTERLSKATLELARQKRIAAGEDEKKVNTETDAQERANAQKTALAKMDAEIAAAERRKQSAIDKRDAAIEEVERLRDVRGETQHTVTEIDEPDEAKAKRAYNRALGDKVEEAKGALNKADARIEKEEKAIESLRQKREALMKEQEAENLKVANEQTKADKDAAEKKAAADKAAADRRIAAEQKAAAEQMRLDREAAAARERQAQKELDQRIKDHQKLLAAEQKAESAAQSRKSAAESKLQQAWGWYRDKGSMAAQMAEEKADAEARKQYVKDFERLKSKRRDWRTAENLSVDDEAVRRVALAQEEKQAAEKHLAEIEKNTADLAAKLDELLQVKG